MDSIPKHLDSILETAMEQKFIMSCDLETGSLLRTLVSSKPGGTFLELGTGAGASTLWMVEGMDADSRLISVEMDAHIQQIAKSVITDERVEFITMDGEEYIRGSLDERFDLIFADTWPGKYYCLEETLSMVKPGGYYIIDDLTPVDTWPEGHEEKANQLIQTLRKHHDFLLTELNWSTGIIIAVKRN